MEAESWSSLVYTWVPWAIYVPSGVVSHCLHCGADTTDATAAAYVPVQHHQTDCAVERVMVNFV